MREAVMPSLLQARFTATFSYALQVRSSVTAGSTTFRTRAWMVLPPTVPYGWPTISHSPRSSVIRSPTLSCMGRTEADRSRGEADGCSGVLGLGSDCSLGFLFAFGGAKTAPGSPRGACSLHFGARKHQEAVTAYKQDRSASRWSRGRSWATPTLDGP